MQPETETPQQKDRRPRKQREAVKAFESGFGTWSICARCPETGDFGFATVSDAMAAGGYIGLVRHGVAAVASQGAPNPYLKFWIVGALLAGKRVDIALKEALARDLDAKSRQVIVVGKDGVSAAHTGRHNVPWCGHIMGDDFVVAGNHLEVETVVQAMAADFKRSGSKGLALAERLVSALERGAAATDDAGGARAAAVMISGPDGYHKIDLRIDDHKGPTARLRELYGDYLSDDVRVDRFLATREKPAGRIPTQVEMAWIYLRRHWLQARKRMGLAKTIRPTAPKSVAPLPLADQDSGK